MLPRLENGTGWAREVVVSSAGGAMSRWKEDKLAVGTG